MRTTWILAAATTLLGLTACGDDTGGSGGASDDGTTGAATTTSSSATTSSSTTSTTTMSSATTGGEGAGGEGGSGTGGDGGHGEGGHGEGGHGEGGHGEDEEVEEHACVHLDEGPFEPLSASAAPEDAPLLEQLHVAYEVELQEAGGGQHDGFVAFAADEDAEFIFFANEEVPITFADAGGNPVEVEATCEADPCSGVCELILAKYKLDLTAGVVTLSIGPTAPHDFLLLVEEAHHDH